MIIPVTGIVLHIPRDGVLNNGIFVMQPSSIQCPKDISGNRRNLSHLMAKAATRLLFGRIVRKLWFAPGYHGIGLTILTSNTWETNPAPPFPDNRHLPRSSRKRRVKSHLSIISSIVTVRYMNWYLS